MTPQAGVSRAGLAFLSVAALLLGAAWPLTRFALLHGAGAAWFALGRAGFSAAVSLAVLAATRRLRLPLRQDLPAVAAVGLLQIGAFFAFAHAAVASVPAGRTALLANATIIFAVPLSLLIGERIGGRRWLAAGVGLAGVVVLMGPWSIDWRAPGLLLGHAELMGAALSWAISMLVVRRFPPVSPMYALLPWVFGLGTLVLLPMAMRHPFGTWPAGAVWPMLGVGLLIAPLGTWCVIQAQLLLPLVVASVGFLSGPVIGVVLASLMLGEAIGPDIVAGAGLILAAAALAATKGRNT